MKKIIPVIMLLVLLVTFPVAAGDNLADVYVNGQCVGKGILLDGTTYVPVRVVSESLGVKVDWDGSVQISNWGPLRRPEVKGEPEFVGMVGESLDLLEQKDFPHYAMICQLGWPIERKDKCQSFAVQGKDFNVAAGIERGSIVIYDSFVDSDRNYNPVFLAGTLVHETSHAVSNKHDNWAEILWPADYSQSLSEKVAFENQLLAFKLLDAPQWMKDYCTGWQDRYQNLN
jgi:hypothetical protein